MAEHPTPVAGIVLAAGTSSRMGLNKLLLEIEGEPMIRLVVRRAIEARLDPMLVVLGHDQELVSRALNGLSHRSVMNPDFENGMTSSLRSGVAALPVETTAALMILGDMPHVTSEMMAAMAEAHRSTAARLVLSDYGGVNAPPTLFGRDLFDEILDLPNDQSPRSVVKRHREQASILEWPAERLKDLDKPEDLGTVRRTSPI